MCHVRDFDIPFIFRFTLCVMCWVQLGVGFKRVWPTPYVLLVRVGAGCFWPVAAWYSTVFSSSTLEIIPSRHFRSRL